MKVFLYDLTFEAPFGLRVSSGDRSGNELQPLMIDQETVVIPESSWKGAFRRLSEQLCDNSVNLQKEISEGLNKAYKEFELLYGTGDFAGRVTFSASVVKGVRITSRTHTVIDRRKRTILEKHLFTETIAYPERVNVKVIVRGEEVLNCWEKTLRFVKLHGIFIGSGKSRGIGYLILRRVLRAEVSDILSEVRFEEWT
jgi:hypothetical protein